MPKRRRRRLRLEPILVLLLAGNLIAGYRYSPLASLGRARIVNCAPFDRPRMESLVQGLANVPLGRIDRRQLETEAMQSPEVLGADYAQNVFGRGELRLRYRQPVARIESATPMMLDAYGVSFPSRQPVSGLVTVRLAEEDAAPALTFGSQWPAERVAYLCSKLPKQLRVENAVLEVQPRSRLCLNMGEGAQIVFGSEDGLDEKLSRLESLLQENPQFLSNIKELNLTAPSRPVFIALSPERKP